MEKLVVVSFRVRGTKKEIERVKARIAAISTCEKVIHMFMRVIIDGTEQSHREKNEGKAKTTLKAKIKRSNSEKLAYVAYTKNSGKKAE